MKRNVLISLVAFYLAVYSGEASAFWGGDSKDAASGLNVASGFDINTVSTLRGPVVSPPARTGEGQHTEMTFATPQGNVTVIIGPWWYWERQSASIQPGQEVAVTGSRATGKDGSLYIFAQRVENLASGETVTFRTETGVPLWSGAKNGNRQQGDAGSAGRGFGGRGGGMRGGRR